MNELLSKLTPMLFYEAEVFDSKDYIYELKFDGARCLAFLFSNHTILINKRQKRVNVTYPELSTLHQNASSPCILDGEIIVMHEGKPSFYHLQKRALLTNPFKIDLIAQQFPVTFVAFDILYCHDQLLIDLPLMERKKILSRNINEDSRLVISRYIEEKGKDFFNLAKTQALEGIVAKEKLSQYYPGKRSRVWLKMKVYQETDLIICGYVPSEHGIKDIIFGDYDEHNKLYKVATIMTNKDSKIIIDYAKTHPSKPLFGLEKEEVIWMKPYLVGIVQYMMKTENGSLRQAVFKGVRNDKIAKNLKKN